MHLYRARHPLLLESELAGTGEVVPIDLRLGDDFDVLVITGPNTGGKTVALETVGLLVAMHQSGLPIPAASDSRLPVYRDVMVDIGDEQSLSQSLSTFSAHLRRILEALDRAGPDVLVMLDELGAGTDPDEGAALGQAILDELRRRGAPTLVTTHLGALKAYAYEKDRVDNAAVEFDIETLRPTYRLLVGEPGASNALTIAQRYGMPQHIVDRARTYQDQEARQLARAIKGTIKRRREAERARDEARHQTRQADARDAELRTKVAELEASQAAFADWSQRVVKLQPGDEIFVRKFHRPGKIVRMQLHKQLAVVDVGKLQVEVPLNEVELEVPSDAR